ncbi:MAG: L,D-transpeptidase family protein [Leptospiraceae bacterium]|nr:L,D-transpeptidase family protein [Leptospiraceae bacterium]
MKIKIVIIVKVFFVSILLYGLGVLIYKKNLIPRIYYLIIGKKTVDDIVKEKENKIDSIFIPIFKKDNIVYPPENLTLVAFKEEQVLEVWTLSQGRPVLIKKYPFTTTSGKMGPKLFRGDGQIPEGFYKIEALNPNSAFYLSLKINYPNEFDLEKAKEDNRNDPGDNIFIHGKDKSIGCIAIGDEAIEELFVLAAKTPRNRLDVVLFPYNMKNSKSIKYCNNCPKWTRELYLRLNAVSQEFKLSK